jgi:hypothetical protein
MRISEYELEGDASVDGQELLSVVGAENADDVEVVGQAMWYTIGSDFMIATDDDAEETGREWLVRRMEELGLPTWMAPPQVTPKGAFTRTRDHLVTPQNDDMNIGGRNVEFETKRATHDTWHILANAYYTADELNQDDGEWRQATVGVVRYMSEHSSVATIPKIDRDAAMWEAWEFFAARAVELFETMQESHVGRDIQKLMNRFTHDWTHTVKFRDGGAVYFVPAQYEAELDALKTLVEEIDARFKTHGKDAELKRLPVVNDDERRRMVQERAEAWLDERVDSALEAGLDEFEDEMDELSEEVVEAAEEELADSDDFAGRYNDLLDLRLSVEDAIDARREEVEGGVKGELLDALKGEEE